MSRVKLGLLVGEDNWAFFADVARHLAAHYDTEVWAHQPLRVPVLRDRLSRWHGARALRRFLDRQDVCLFEWASDLLAAASQVPTTSTLLTRLHSFELFEWAPRIDWRRVSRVVVLSEAMRGFFGARHPEHAAKVVVVPNGVDLSRFSPAHRDAPGFNLGMLCYVAPIKRVYEVVLAVHELRASGYPVHLHVAGRPADERYAFAVTTLVSRLRLEGAVSFHGQVADPAAWLRGIDIFVSNSYWEGQQVALLEAMASGCYCLSHAWPGAEEVLPPTHLFTTESEFRERLVAHLDLPAAERARSRADLRAIACARFDIGQTCAGIHRAIEQARQSRSH
jgi:glycosyltransferase involved in cell wall biosynthesis